MQAIKLSFFVCCLFVSGCGIPDRSGEGVVGYFTPEQQPYDAQLFNSYRQMELNRSNSADVLALVHRADYELLSQSKSVIVSTGQQKEGYKTWFDMAAFDENEMTVKRKYFFEIDEKPKAVLLDFKGPKGEGLRFDCDVVLPAKVLNEPYANESAKRIAILKQILEGFRKDIADVSQDNKSLATSGMLVNQALSTVLTKLNTSPALATRLNEPAGVEFSHLNMDRGKIQMVVINDIARVKIRLGSFMRRKLAGDETYRCPRCGYVYDPFFGDPAHGIKPGTDIEALPKKRVCSICASTMIKR